MGYMGCKGGEGVETEMGQSALTLWWKPAPDGAEVTAVTSGEQHVFLPERVGGLPVTALGHHAFSPNRPAPEGEPLRIVCGGGAPGDKPRGIEAVTLPPTLRRVGDYAFYNCSALKELHLAEPVNDWGSGVFMNCGHLRRFFIRAQDGRVESLAYFAGELATELDVSVDYPDGGIARLIFPEYREVLEENAPAHHFDFHLYGSGYPYRHVFRDRALSLQEYDRLFPGLLEKEHDPNCALRLAWYRLCAPRELTEQARERYLTYLKSRTEAVLAWLLEERDSRGLAWFLPRSGADAAALRAAAETARRLGLTEPLALLLERLRQAAPEGLNKSFDL